MAEQAQEPDLFHQIGTAVEEALLQDGVELTPASAWNFAYGFGMGVEHQLPHIVESNDLAKAAWRARATRVLEWLKSNLAPGNTLSDEEALNRLDTGWKVARDAGYTGNKANLAGSSLEYALAYLVEKFCGVTPLVKKSIRNFRGYEIARRAEVEQLDVALFSYDDFRIFISAFWTTRKDRIAADLYEATFLRRRRPDIAVAFVVNEFRTNLLNHLLNAADVDRVYHISIDALLNAHLPFADVDPVARNQLVGHSKAVSDYYSYLSLRESIHDLTALFSDIDRLKPANLV